MLSKLLYNRDIQILINNSGEPHGGMKRSNMGRIINIISTSVRELIDDIGLSITLRGAMGSWSKSLSRELPPCITINNVLPGFTDTDRLGSLSQSIAERTGSTTREARDN